MPVINTNVAATITSNALAKNERAMSQTMERLSTGQRINSAGDDAAGLAISSKMTSQIRGLDQAVRNGNDAISMIQTQDGAMIEVTNMLQRMRELAVQAASGTNGSTDRDALQTEFAALAAQINTIGNDTSWNGVNILDTTATTANFQIGANAGQTVSHTFAQIESSDVAGQTAAESQFVDAGASAEVQKLTLGGGTFAVGDTILFKIDGVKFGANVEAVNGSNEITSVKVHGRSTAADGSNTDAFTSTALAGAITLSVAANVLTFTGTTTGASADFVVDSGSGLVKRGLVAGAQGVDIATASNATNAINTIDAALSKVSTARASAGAVINRLEYAVDNLANVSQNTAASRSRILDADYAAESTELARTQIIQQAGTAMLAQANQQAQSVLALLK
jgi:flagellin